MQDFLELLGGWGVPVGIVGAIAAFIAILNFVYFILDKGGKTTKGFLNIVKMVKEKKAKKAAREKLINDTIAYMEQMREHTSPESIARRDNWMHWVNDRAEKYDESIALLSENMNEIKEALRANTKVTDKLFVQDCRTIIISFADKVSNHERLVSHEEFNRVFKVYEDYEAFLADHEMTNGEVDVAYDVIKDAYQYRLTHQCFFEDTRRK